MSGVQSIFTQAYPPILKDYYDSLWASNLFNSTNTATGSGGGAATLQGMSGLVTYEGITIPADDFLQCSITNAYASTSKVCQVWVVNGENQTAIQGVAWCTSGTINFKLAAISDAESEVIVAFKFLN